MTNKMYRTNMKDVPKVEGLSRKDGWIDMQVQFLVDKKTAGANHVVGWTVLKPGASHEAHLHRNCDEFFIVLKGKGVIRSEHGDDAFRRGRRGLLAARRLPWLRQHLGSRTWCWCGAGWAPARSRIPATKFCPARIERVASDRCAERWNRGTGR